MRGIELSEEQRCAVFAPGSVIVRAGAGSGKTEVLAQRFAALVSGDVPGMPALAPVEIAAITFTEKAALDMRSRIAQVLGERLAKAEDAGMRHHLLRARRTLALARISTIHGFCARLLREHALEADLVPGFRVLDEDESDVFLERAVKRLIVEAVRGRDPGALGLVSALGLHGAGRADGAVEVVMGLIGELGRRGLKPDWLVEATRETARRLRAQAEATRNLATRAAAFIEELLDVEAAPKLDELRAAWPRYRELLLGLNADSKPDVLGDLRALTELFPDAKGKVVGDIVRRLRALVVAGGLGRGVGLEGELIDAYGAGRAAGPMGEAAGFVAAAAAELDRLKLWENVLTFDDMAVRALGVLRDAPAVLARYRSELSVLMVDEYQDTDPVQHELVELLSGRAAPGGPPAPAPDLFIVADEKQSIYRFRGADVTAFARAQKLGLTRVSLRDNHRSIPPLLEFVNALAQSAMRSELSPAPEYWVEWSPDHHLKPVRKAPSGPAVEVMVSARDGAPSGARAAELREIEARFLARRISELIEAGTSVEDPKQGGPRPARFGDVAILMRALTDVATYERALERARVPFYTVKGRGFYACPEVSDLIALLAALDSPPDPIALAAALRSPLFGLSDQCLLEIALRAWNEEGAYGPDLAGIFFGDAADLNRLGSGRDEAVRARDVLRELRTMVDRAPLAEILERALELTCFEPVMLAQSRGRERVANVRKLVEVARRLESRRSLAGFSDFVAHLRRLSNGLGAQEAKAQILGEGENVVRLMTIHQAKGLEFPVVIVADMARREPGDSRTVLLSPGDGLLMSATVGAGYRLPNPALNEYRKARAEEERAEAARLLYVAVTRARDRLILSEGADPRAGWAGQLRKALGAERVADFVRSGAAAQTLALGEAEIVLRRVAPLEDARADTPGPAPCRSPDEADFVALRNRRLAFAPPAEREIVVTPTALDDFCRCPRQYELRETLGLAGRTPLALEQPEALRMGIVAHAVLERLLGMPGVARTREAMAALVRRFAAGAMLTAQQLDELAQDIALYVADQRARDGGTAARVLGREIPFFLRVAGDDVVVFVEGRIDLLIDDGKRLLVRDYKYARAAEAGPDYRVQLECYGLAVAEAYPGRPVAAEIIYLRGGPRAVEIDLPRPAEIRQRLLEGGRAMLGARASGEYPKKPTVPSECLRLGCGYVERCWAGAP